MSRNREANDSGRISVMTAATMGTALLCAVIGGWQYIAHHSEPTGPEREVIEHANDDGLTLSDVQYDPSTDPGQARFTLELGGVCRVREVSGSVVPNEAGAKSRVRDITKYIIGSGDSGYTFGKFSDLSRDFAPHSSPSNAAICATIRNLGLAGYEDTRS